MQKKCLFSGAAALVVCAFAANANAETPFTANSVELGGGLNYGIYMGDDDGDPPNPYGLGIGLGAGYTLDFGLYLGGEFNYFLGGSEEAGGIETSWNIMQFGAEVGYDLGLSPAFVLRPKLGLGLGIAYAEVSGDGFSADDSENGLMIPIGVEALYSLGGWHLGGQIRYAIFGVTTETTNPVTGETVEHDTDMSGLIIGVVAGTSF